MTIAFTLIYCIGASYFLLKHRRFDVLSVAYFSAGVYFLPGFFGVVKFPVIFQVLEDVPLVPKAYVVMIAVLFSIVAAAMVYDLFPHRTRYHVGLRGSVNAGYWAAGIAVVGFFLTVATMGSALLNPDKTEMLARFNRWTILWEMGASLLAVFAFARKSWLLFGIAVLLLLGDIYIGIRVSFAMSFIACFLLWAEEKGRGRFGIRYFKIAALAALFLIFLLVYKLLFVQIKEGNWDVVRERLANPAFYTKSVTHSEPFITQAILNQVMIDEFMVGPDHFRAIAFQFLFFAPQIGANAISFNDLFQSKLFPNAIGWGMANNIWAEMWSSGGWGLLIVFLFGNAFLLMLMSRAMRVDNPEVRALGALLFAYWAFYLHRNDLFTEINLLKRVFVLGFFCIVGSMLIHDALHRIRRRIKRAVRAAASVS
jgi:hypothetical protein